MLIMSSFLFLFLLWWCHYIHSFAFLFFSFCFPLWLSIFSFIPLLSRVPAHRKRSKSGYYDYFYFYFLSFCFFLVNLLTVVARIFGFVSIMMLYGFNSSIIATTSFERVNTKKMKEMEMSELGFFSS